MVPSLKQTAAQQDNPIRAAFTEIISFVFTFFYLACSLYAENQYFSLIANPVFVINHFIFLNTLLQVILFLVIYPKLNPVSRDYPTSKKKQGAQYYVTKIAQSAVAYVGFWAVAHFFAVIFGAPLLESAEKTSAWAAFVASLVAVPGLCVLGPKPRKWLALFNLMIFDSSQKRTLFYSAICTVIGSWASAMVIPLDWDRPWQVWPIPGVVGALSGYLVGILIGALKIVKDLKFSKVH